MPSFIHFYLKRGGLQKAERYINQFFFKIMDKMASIQLNISIPNEQKEFLDENPSLSPSKLLQGTIENIQNTMRSNPQLIEANKTIEKLRKMMEMVKNNLSKASDFIFNNGLQEKFNKEYPI